MFRGHKF